jgi:hypothetical protein
MNAEFRARKQAIRNFMQAHYTDERLAMLLAHAQQGKLAYVSCCCFIGIPTADHPLCEKRVDYTQPHYIRALLSIGQAPPYAELGPTDVERRRILIPMVRAEVRRRDKLRSLVVETATLQSV